MSWRPAFVAAALLAVALAPGARAHQSDPNIVARIDSVTPALPGVTIEVRAGVADQLLVVNDTDTPVEVLGADGTPFLRIGKRQVEANYASADWYLSNSPIGLAATPAPGGKPDWRVVAFEESWGWFDHRMHDRARPLTPELRKARRTVRLSEWTVPLRYGGQPVTVNGHVEYRPVLGAFRSRVEHVPMGISAVALDGRVPGLFVKLTGNAGVIIEGPDGGLFAVIGPNKVQVNRASLTWQEDQRLRGKPLPSHVASATGVDLVQVDTKPQLTWLDRRLAYAPGVPPDDVLRAGHPTTLVEWRVSAGGAFITGTTTWVPADTGGSTRRSPVPFVLAAAALFGVLVAIQRRVARR